MKTGEGLARYAEAAAIVLTPYIYATFGQILTERKLAEVRRLYPERMSEKRYQYARKHYIGKRTNDCYGLIKRYKWSGGDAENPSLDDTPIYNGKEDVNANTAYQKATVKGKISTIPEVRGLIVWKPGHVGVYLGNGRVAEARGFDYGTVITKLSDRPWTNWFQEVGIRYDQEPQPEPTPGKDKLMIELEVLRKTTPTMKGPNVLVFQSMMNTLGIRDDEGKELVEDSSFGKRCEQAAIRYQKKVGLTPDGVVGPNTWNKLLNG